MNIVYNIDCMIGMKEYPDKYFDLAVVDPPYGVQDLTGKEFSHSRGIMKNRAFGKDNGKVNDWDKAPTQDYFDELFRVSKNQIIWGGNYFNLPKYRCPIVWDKCQPWKKFSQIELAWTSFNKPAAIIKIDNRTGDKIHPTQKPIKLYDWIFTNYAECGMKILDTHVGSGSSRISADKHDLEFIGYELDANYWDGQDKRFAEHKRQLKLF